jgi:molybdenum ABC transporter molybdate-binding protein
MGSARNAFVLSIVAAAALVALLWWAPARPARSKPGQPLLVYCAAGLKAPVEQVAHEYERLFGGAIQLQYGGSGTLLSNLRVTGRGDLFLAADQSYLDLARASNLLAEIIPLAHMIPVIAVPKGNPRQVRGVAELLRPGLRIGLANPDAAAIGKVTRDLLQKAGVWAALEKQTTVFKPTVNDVANDIKLGAVDAGILWDATVGQYPELQGVAVPELVPGRQAVAIGVLRSSTQPTAALRFARYLGARDKGLKVFASAGFRPADGDLWAAAPEVVLYSGGLNRLGVEQAIQRFELREGARVARVYNGCGILVAQLKAGQRPDAFLACDVSYLRDVRDMFSDATEISETDIVILVPKGNPKRLLKLADLGGAGLRLGVANAQQSTLGDLTARLLRTEGCYDAVMANVKAQTPTADLLVNQIRTGSLDAVVVYEVNASQVRDLFELIPIQQPGALAVQPYAVGRNSEHRLLMERLLEAIRAPESRRHYESVGFRWRGAANPP